MKNKSLITKAFKTLFSQVRKTGEVAAYQVIAKEIISTTNKNDIIIISAIEFLKKFI